MSSLSEPRFTREEYFAFEREAEYKNEFLAGAVRPVARVNSTHCLIVGNLIGEVGQQLKGKTSTAYACRMRVVVSATGFYTYPDMLVVRDKPRVDDADQDTLANPTVIIEVLSSSTEAYDRGEKFAHYQRISSLQEYVLVAQDKPRIERFLRQPDGQWLYSEVSGLQESVALTSIGCSLALAEVYDKVEFPANGNVGN